MIAQSESELVIWLHNISDDYDSSNLLYSLVGLIRQYSFSYRIMVLFKLWICGTVCPFNCQVSSTDHSKVLHNVKRCKVVRPTSVRMEYYSGALLSQRWLKHKWIANIMCGAFTKFKHRTLETLLTFECWDFGILFGRSKLHQRWKIWFWGYVVMVSLLMHALLVKELLFLLNVLSVGTLVKSSEKFDRKTQCKNQCVWL